MKRFTLFFSLLFVFVSAIFAEETSSSVVLSYTHSVGSQVTSVDQISADKSYVLQVVTTGGAEITGDNYMYGPTIGGSSRVKYATLPSSGDYTLYMVNFNGDNTNGYTLKMNLGYIPSFSGSSAKGGFGLVTASTYKSVFEETSTSGVFYIKSNASANALYFSYASNGAAQDAIGTDNTSSSVNSKTEYAATFKIYEVVFTPKETATLADFKTLIDNASSVIATKKLGYPVETSTAYTTFQTAISTATTTYKTGSFTKADYTTLSNAISTFKLSTDNVRMPEDGKAYTITAVTKAGKKAYMNYTEGGYTLVATTDDDNTNYPTTAKLICHKTTNGEYVFLNNDGKYLTVKAGSYNNAVNGNKGYMNGYTPVEFTYTSNSVETSTSFYPQLLTIEKLANGDKATGVAESYLTIKGFRSNGDKKEETIYFVIKNQTSYDAASKQYYDDTYSSALLIEEVSYPNTVTFNDATGIDGVSKIATFSAPFATIKPEGVKAYYVGSTNDNKATMTEISGNIPANTGVILTSETGDAVTMVPVAGEEVATVENNKLGNTAGADKTITDETALVLGLSDGTVAFYKAQANTTLKMNKAYLTNAAAGSALKLDFGTATGINNATIADAAENAPVYDLTGRRVAKTVKGNLYIKGGKKYIAQ